FLMFQLNRYLHNPFFLQTSYQILRWSILHYCYPLQMFYDNSLNPNWHLTYLRSNSIFRNCKLSKVIRSNKYENVSSNITYPKTLTGISIVRLPDLLGHVIL